MKIVVCVPPFEAFANEFHNAAKDAEIVFCSRNAPDEIWSGADVIVGLPPLEVLQKLPELKLLQLQSAGVEPYSVVCEYAPGAVLCCASGAYGVAISEHMTAQLLAGMKRLEGYRENQKRREWKDLGHVPTVYGSTVLAVGMGDIGSRFAAIMKAMGARVIGLRRSPSPCPEFADAVYTRERLDELLPEADIVALTLPETADTKNILSRERIALMKKGAFVLNVGRGSAVDQNALTEALEAGRLGGAFLDVCTPEPLPAEHPLWDAPELYLTPHISGGFHADETVRRIVSIACHNIGVLARGGEYKSRVDILQGYRARE